MKVKISNDAEHEVALARIEEIMLIEVLSEGEASELVKLSVAVEAYEEVRWPMEQPSEEEIRLFRREQERHPEELQEDTLKE